MIDDISKGIQAIKDIVTFWKTNRQQRSDAEAKAIDAILLAANETRAYIADIRDGKQTEDRNTEKGLAKLWRSAHTAMVPINYELADRCLIKADCWSDPKLFDDDRYSNIPLDLNSIIDLCRELRRDQASRE